MKIRINSSMDLCALSLEAEPPPGRDRNASFFTMHASSQGAEVTLFLRGEDLSALCTVLSSYLFHERGERHL